MNPANIVSTLRYLDKALNGLRDMGLMPAKPDEMPVVALINRISDSTRRKPQDRPHFQQHHGFQRGGARADYSDERGRAI